MHKFNVLTFGPKNFNTSLDELKDYFNFKLTTINKDINKEIFDNYDIMLIHEDCLKEDLISKDIISNNNIIKILVCNNIHAELNFFSDKLLLPSSVEEINLIVKNSFSKKNFNKNSSIKIKSYILDKNEKKLKKDKLFILLTEKEIKLLELLLNNKNATHKDQILNQVWKYSNDADTHTVETHIYRLRKKIRNKFSDENFILNDKAGYSI